MATTAQHTNLPSETRPKSKKRAHGGLEKQHFKGLIHTSKTISAPPFSYIHLSLNSSLPPSASDLSTLDVLTARTHLTSALTQFLGLSGSAISVDILKVTSEGDVWVRVPREDAGPFVAAVGGWVGGDGEEKVGWRVVGRGNWLSALGEDGSERIWAD